MMLGFLRIYGISRRAGRGAREKPQDGQPLRFAAHGRKQAGQDIFNVGVVISVRVGSQ